MFSAEQKSSARFLTRGGADAPVRARPRRTPWSGAAITRETEADGGVGRGPGNRPSRMLQMNFKIQDASAAVPRPEPTASVHRGAARARPPLPLQQYERNEVQCRRSAR